MRIPTGLETLPTRALVRLSLRSEGDTFWDTMEELQKRRKLQRRTQYKNDKRRARTGKRQVTGDARWRKLTRTAEDRA